MPDPLAPHTATPEELRARIDAERAGEPFLVLRDGDGEQRIVALANDRPERLSVGRNPSNDVSVPWDEEVSRLHAELERIGGEWTISDDGLSRNGTFVNGSRIGGRVRLRDGDVIRAGATTIAYRQPAASELSSPTHVGVPRVSRDDLPVTQRQILVALARPFSHNEFAAPASNNQIAEELHLSVDAVKAHLRMLFQRFGIEDLPVTQRQILVALARPFRSNEFAAPASNGQIAEELHLSVDAVKAHLRMLFQRFGIEDLPPNQKRSRLVAEALQSGIVSQREL